MLCLLYHICFGKAGYKSSDYKSLGSESMGSECEGRFQTQLVQVPHHTFIGFGTFLHIWNPNIPNPMIDNLMIHNLTVQNKYNITNIKCNYIYHIYIYIYSFE